MESLKIADDFIVALRTPTCELNWDGCQKSSAVGYRVHGCAFYFACEACHQDMTQRLRESFTRFAELYCKNCGISFCEGDYYTVFKL